MFNVLLQVLDDGRLSDNQGHVVNFTNTIIILTSNLGSQILNKADFDDDSSDDQAMIDAKKSLTFDNIMEVVRQHFRPEFLNRLDEIILFNKLSRKNMQNIAEIQFLRFAKRLTAHNIRTTLDESAKIYLAQKGYNPVYGARPLKRLIQHEIENVFAEKILRGEVLEGKNIKVIAKNDKIEFV